MKVMRLRVWALAVFFVCLQAVVFAAEAPDTSAIAAEVFSDLSVDEINRFIASANQELEADAPLLNFATLKEIMAKGVRFDLEGLAALLGRKLFQELLHQTSLMGKLLFLAVLCTVLQNLQSSFARSQVAALAYGVAFVFLTVIAFTAFYQVLQVALQAVDAMVTFMEALLPLLLSLLAGAGAVATAGLFSPFMLMVVTGVGVLVKHCVLPLLLVGAALECVNYLTEQYKLRALADLFKQWSMLLLAFMMLLFFGLVAVQGIAGSVSDGLALRTAKFATANFVPVVGKVFSDAVELVMGASLLLKNAVGIFGVLAVGSLCLTPILKLFSLTAVIKLTGALVEPMGDARMAKCLTSLGGYLLLVTGAVIAVALMFFLGVTILVGAGNVAYMLR